MQARDIPSCGVYVSVRLSATFVDSVKTNKHIFKFLPSGSHVSPFFPIPNVTAIRGRRMRMDRQKSRFWANVWLHRVLCTLGAATAIHSGATDHGELMTLVAGNRRSLLMAGDDHEVYDKKPQRYFEDSWAVFNCTQWQIWSLSNNNKRLRSKYCNVWCLT